LSGCRGGGRSAPSAESPEAPAEAPAPESAPVASEILLLYAGGGDDLLHAEKRSVVPITAAEDRAKQCLAELLRGPAEGLIATIPQGVRVREVYILGDGTAYADLTGELLTGTASLCGSQRELMIVYSIIDTLALNIAGLKRVGILIDGTPRETIAGHIFIGQPLAPDFHFVDPGVHPAPSASVAGSAARGAAGAPGADGAVDGEAPGTAGTTPGAASGAGGDDASGKGSATGGDPSPGGAGAPGAGGTSSPGSGSGAGTGSDPGVSSGSGSGAATGSSGSHDGDSSQDAPPAKPAPKPPRSGDPVRA
jgi:hypothetical protein